MITDKLTVNSLLKRCSFAKFVFTGRMGAKCISLWKAYRSLRIKQKENFS